MTIDEFIIALEKSPRDWYLSQNGVPMRQLPGKGPANPFQAMASGKFKTYLCCGLEIGLKSEDIETIADAVWDEEGNDRNLRGRILAACGLK